MSFPTLMRCGFLNVALLPANERKSAAALTPIEYIMNVITLMRKKPAASMKDRVLVLKASTGSGKSTVLIQYLYKHFSELKKNIAVTQPRVITAVDIPMIMVNCDETLKLDVNIGYTTGSFKRLPKEKGIIYMTIDSLVQQFVGNGPKYIMNRYSFIVVDEVHERNLATDNCLFRIKALLKDYYDSPECPFIILASATFNQDIFLRYFGLGKKNYIEIEGQTYEKTKVWPPYSLANYSNYLVNIAVRLHFDNLKDLDGSMRDILIFLSSGAEIADMVKKINEINLEIYENRFDIEDVKLKIEQSYAKGGRDKKYYICPISLTRSSYQAGSDTYHTIFSDISSLRVPITKEGKTLAYVNPSRKLFISTNIAETGITINTLKYCLDSGYYNSVEFNPAFGCKLILQKPVTNGMSVQRMGRIGRKAAGIWYPAYTQETLAAMQTEQFSEITFSDITANLLAIIAVEQDVIEDETDKTSSDVYSKYKLQKYKNFILQHRKNMNIQGIDLFEMPSAEMITYGLEKLNTLGFIDSSMKITLFGHYAQRMRFINLESCRMILAGYTNKVSIKWLITIAAIYYVSNSGLYTKITKSINYLSNSNPALHSVFIADDFILQLGTFEYVMAIMTKKMKTAYNSNKNPVFKFEEWCAENSINHGHFIAASQFRDELILNFVENGLNPNAYHTESFIETFGRNFDEGMVEVRKIKQCIYEGFRMNMAVWMEGTMSYSINRKGVPIVIGSQYVQKNAISQDPPNYVIVSDYSLQLTQKNIFKIQAKNLVSVLDGHIEPDINF